MATYIFALLGALGIGTGIAAFASEDFRNWLGGLTKEGGALSGLKDKITGIFTKPKPVEPELTAADAIDRKGDALVVGSTLIGARAVVGMAPAALEAAKDVGAVIVDSKAGGKLVGTVAKVTGVFGQGFDDVKNVGRWLTFRPPVASATAAAKAVAEMPEALQIMGGALPKAAEATATLTKATPTLAATGSKFLSAVKPVFGPTAKAIPVVGSLVTVVVDGAHVKELADAGKTGSAKAQAFGSGAQVVGNLAGPVGFLLGNLTQDITSGWNQIVTGEENVTPGALTSLVRKIPKVEEYSKWAGQTTGDGLAHLVYGDSAEGFERKTKAIKGKNNQMQADFVNEVMNVISDEEKAWVKKEGNKTNANGSKVGEFYVLMELARTKYPNGFPVAPERLAAITGHGAGTGAEATQGETLAAPSTPTELAKADTPAHMHNSHTKIL